MATSLFDLSYHSPLHLIVWLFGELKMPCLVVSLGIVLVAALKARIEY